MGSLAAGSIVLGLMVIVLIPIALATWFPRAAFPITLSYVALMLVVGSHYTSFSFAEAPAAIAPVVPGRSASSADGCRRVLEISEQSGIILDRSDPGRVVVRGRIWEELPQAAKDALVGCLGSSAPGGPSGLKIVEQP